MNDFLNDDLLSQADPNNEPDPDVPLRVVLDSAAAAVGNRFGDQPLVEAAIHSTLGKIYAKLGRYSESEQHHLCALAIRRKLLGDELYALGETTARQVLEALGNDRQVFADQLEHGEGSPHIEPQER